MKKPSTTSRFSPRPTTRAWAVRAAWGLVASASWWTVSVGGSAGCGPGANACLDEPDTSLAPSFEADVLPILRQSCGLSTSCHGNPSSSRNYLGPSPDSALTPDDVALVLADNVGVPSNAAPTMNLITPGDAAQSFLLYKIEDRLGCPELACDGDCGDSMPPGNQLLPADARRTIAAWIQAGAKAN